MLASWNDAMNRRCFRGISFQPRQDGITLPWFHLFSSSLVLGISLTLASPADFTTLIIEYASKRIFSSLTNCTGSAKSSLWYFTREPVVFLSIFSFGRYPPIFCEISSSLRYRSSFEMKQRKVATFPRDDWKIGGAGSKFLRQERVSFAKFYSLSTRCKAYYTVDAKIGYVKPRRCKEGRWWS